MAVTCTTGLEIAEAQIAVEVQHWIGESLDCGYLSSADAARLSTGLEEVGRMLNSMIEKSDSFCRPAGDILSESAPEYFAQHHGH